MKEVLSIKTPCYVIDYEELNYNFNSLKAAFTKYWSGPLGIGYSVKTNHLKWVLEYMKHRGTYAEVVSSDEYRYAELVGFAPEEIIYNGPNKSTEMLAHAIKNKSIINIDSFHEIKKLSSLAKNMEIKVGLRVNFDMESVCPNESFLGYESSRFGFCLENGSFEDALKLCAEFNITVCGLHMHQSTKTRSIDVFKALAKKATDCIKQFSLHEQLEYIDIGGGFFGGRFFENKPTFNDYAKTICEELLLVRLPEKVMLIIEPGASLISTPISYFTKVVDIKEVRDNTFVTIDGTILHINPFLVKRLFSHNIFSEGSIHKKKQIVCGSTCMENDRLLYLENSIELQVGDTVEFKYCGSYTMCYNSCFTNLPPNVYVKIDNEYQLIREAWSPERLL